MARPSPPRDPDRNIAPGTTPSRGSVGDANALWRYERHRRRNLMAEPGPHDVVLVLEKLKADFNVPKIFRSAEAFGARAVHMIDIGPFDPAPAKGGFKHVPARFHQQLDDCLRVLLDDGYTLLAMDPFADALIGDVELPSKSAFILGHELRGLSEEVLADERVQRVRIPQWGSVDSLNVAVAASVALYEYARQHGRQQRP